MARRSSSGMEVLLGLLTIEAMSGYDLGQAIRASVGHMWNESYGQIYPNLKRLAAEGLVTSKTVRQRGKPDRHVYSITGKGRERLAAWLAVEPQPEIPRNEMLLKLFFGAQVPAEILMGYVERMVERERALFQKLTLAGDEAVAQARQYPDAPYWRMAARFGQLELQAHLRWAEETLAQLNSLRGKKQSRLKTRKKESDGGS